MLGQKSNVFVREGEGVVTIRQRGLSQAVVANVLGEEPCPGGRLIYLDRLVHRPHETELGEYGVSGAVSSILFAPDGVIGRHQDDA